MEKSSRRRSTPKPRARPGPPATRRRASAVDGTRRPDRAQKDRLRSAAKPEASPSTWLVPPEKQAKFEQVTPEPALSPFRPAAIQSPAAPAIQLPFAAPVPGVMANRPPVIPLAPIVVPPPPPAAPLPKFANPPAIAPMPLPTAGLGSTISMIDPDEAFAPVKVKADLPSGYAPAGRNSRRSERPKPARHVVEDVSEPPPVVVEEEVTVPPTARIFPVKLAIAVVVLAVVGVLVGRASLPGGALRKGSAETAAALPAAEDEEPETQSAVAGTGQVVVNTEPTGARVTLDGKPVGVSPLTLDGISAGSHVVVVSAPSGSVKRTIRVVADHSISLDVPIFSGWVAVFAPFVVTIAENSATLGTNEQGRLLVAPGRHMLVLSNDGARLLDRPAGGRDGWRRGSHPPGSQGSGEHQRGALGRGVVGRPQDRRDADRQLHSAARHAGVRIQEPAVRRAPGHRDHSRQRGGGGVGGLLEAAAAVEARLGGGKIPSGPRNPSL